jgi:xylan 1,4-beta-xylosidase
MMAGRRPAAAGNARPAAGLAFERRQSLRAMAAVLVSLALARPALGRGGGAAPRSLVLRASARPGGGGPQGPFRAEDFAVVGVFDADWLLDARYARLLDMMAAAAPGAFRAVRVFGVLNSGEREDTFPTASGSVWPAPDAPKDFSVAFAALDALVSRGLVPFLPLTFFPAAVSPSPIEPPPDDARWRELVRAFLDGVVARFGAAEVGRWWFEVWNEPNMPPFWRGDFDGYLRLYRATAEAVRASGHKLRLGGPVIAWMPNGEGEALMTRFLEFLRDAPELPCDFLSFHRKGIWTDEEAEPRMERLLDAAEFTAEAALRLVPERCRGGLPIVNDEADMKVGFDHPYEPRLTERFPSWLAAAAIGHAALGARHATPGLRFIPAADNANQHLVREPFDGRRSLATRTDAAPDDLVKLPVFAFYELLPLLGDRHGSVEAPDVDAFFPGTALHHAITAADDRVAALLTFHPVEGADARPVLLDYALRDVPWPRANVALFRIDGEMSNAYAAAGKRMPASLPAAAAGPLREAAELGVAAPLRSGVSLSGGRLRAPIRLAPYATALLWVTPFLPGRRPAAPRWIAVQAEAGNVVLRWTPDRDPGFWSYEVLRSTPGAPPRRVSPVPLRSAMWVDTAPPPGKHRYEVRTISASGVRGPAAPSPPVRL